MHKMKIRMKNSYQETGQKERNIVCDQNFIEYCGIIIDMYSTVVYLLRYPFLLLKVLSILFILGCWYAVSCNKCVMFVTENLVQYVTTMVCIAVKGKPLVGVIHKPFEEPETYWAWKERGNSENFGHKKVK